MLKYKLVQKKNFTKGAEADSKLYYAMAQSAGRMEHEALVDAISTMSSASKQLMRWVMYHPDLKQKLENAGWHKGARRLTPLMVELIYDSLGEP